jgi:hypothetical protein
VSAPSSTAAFPQQSFNIYPVSASIIIGVPVAASLLLLLVLGSLVVYKQREGKTPLKLVSVNPLTANTVPIQYVVLENGNKYYFDGPSGKLLALGWQRVSDGVDSWYVNNNGLQSSWTPVYR